ncbi:MAG: carbohydrate kinase family protein [bacterium]
MPLLIGLGELLWDLLPTGPMLGGAPANFAVTARSLGASAAVVSRIGNDENGNKALAQLAKLGLNVDQIQVDPNRPTGTVSVSLNDFGHPQYTILENVAWDFIHNLSTTLNLAQSADSICFGSLVQRSETSRRSIHEILEAMNPGALRIFDVNLRQDYFSRAVLERSLELCNVLKISDEELPRFADCLGLEGSQEVVLQYLGSKYHLLMTALTRGSKGSLLVRGDERSDHPGVPTQVADTIGAGDAFTAAMALGIMAGLGLDETNDRANRVAAFVCSQHGATPAFPADLGRLFV